MPDRQQRESLMFRMWGTHPMSPNVLSLSCTLTWNLSPKYLLARLHVKSMRTSITWTTNKKMEAIQGRGEAGKMGGRKNWGRVETGEHLEWSPRPSGLHVDIFRKVPEAVPIPTCLTLPQDSLKLNSVTP